MQPNLDRFKDIDFYCPWVYGRRLNTPMCCLVHLAPPKDGITGEPCELYQWQKELIFDKLQRYKLNMLKKATGIGASQISLMYLLWKALTDKSYENSICVILTGPNWFLSRRLVSRLRHMAEEAKVPITHSDANSITIGTTEIRSFPSHNLSGLRSLTSVRFCLVDEADYLGTLLQQNECEIVISRYVGKTDCSIYLVSTPSDPEGLFSRLEASDTNYHKTFIDWTIPYGSVLKKEHIDKARLLPSWQREYCNQYTGLEGNTFNFEDLEAAKEDYIFTPEHITDNYYFTTMGIDTGFASSAFSATLCFFVGDTVYVAYSDEWRDILWQDAVQKCQQLIQKYRVQKVYIDSSNTPFVKELYHIYEPHMINYNTFPSEHLEQFIHSPAKSPLIVPIAFNKYSERLLQGAIKILGHRRIKIHESFKKLHIGLHSAQSREYKLLKEKSPHNDVLDSFMLSLMRVRWSKEI